MTFKHDSHNPQEKPATRTGSGRKKVSILIPCLNEVNSIANCIRDIYAFDPPDGGFEVIVIDGLSNDGTRDILSELKEKYPDLTIINNPKKTAPHAMNLGIEHAKGEYIVRADARCVHPKSYLKDLIELSERTKAANVGGIIVPDGDTYIQKSIAAAYRSPLAMGGALRDRGDFIGETDAVYGGCFRRDDLIKIGMYDVDMARNEDDELSFRLRKTGGKVFQSGKIKVKYFPRKKYQQLFKQFLQYGYWKIFVLKKHPTQASLRHLLPGLLVLFFLLFFTASLFNVYAFFGLLIFSASYVLALAVESLRILFRENIKLWPGVMVSICFIHFGYGTGFLIAFISRLLNLKLKYFETLSR